MRDKLTRVDKLYSKELVFTTTTKQVGKIKCHRKLKNSFLTLENSRHTKKNQSTSTYKIFLFFGKRPAKKGNRDAK